MKGIMFKEPLYNAIVRGNKTQTRRVVKIKEKALNDIILHGVSVHTNLKGFNPVYWADISGKYDNGNSVRKPVRINPRYQIGETVYLKEPYLLKGKYTQYAFDYASFLTVRKTLKWNNKMFMPEKYARNFIKITNIRVERLQDISDYDILKEGVPHQNGMTLKDQWKFLWDSINKYPFNWAVNPWNWVYEFELTEKP